MTGKKKKSGEKKKMSGKTPTNGGDKSTSNTTYSIGEEVLVYRGPRIYEADVLQIRIRKKEWNYFVHYIDSSESSDEWVGVDRLMKYTEKNIVKQQVVDKKHGVDTNPKSGCSTQTQPEVLNGAKGKKKVGDSSMEEDEDCHGQNMIDFISQMPNDILFKILSPLPLKTAVITSILSKRWRFVWLYRKRLDLDDRKALNEIDEKLCAIQQQVKYITKVNSVIRSHLNPTLLTFEIGFDLDKTYIKDIDNWLRFALDKKVVFLQLDLRGKLQTMRDTKENYDLPLPLSDGSMVRLSEWPSSSSMVVETLSLVKLVLLSVNVSELVLTGLLKNSPRLDRLYIIGSGLTDVNVGGRDINLKELKLMYCSKLKSISLYDFDLASFLYLGQDIEIRLTNLSRVKELDIGQVSVGLNSKVFSTIASVASTLEVLSLDISRKKEDIERDAEGFPVLPHVKILDLTLPTELDDNITEFIEIAKKCPNLENFKIWLYWCAPITENKAWYTSFGYHFKHIEIAGYRGLMSDFKLAMYMLGNASKIVIDPSCHPYDLDVLTESQAMKIEEAGRSHAISELATRCVFPQVELVIL